MSRPIKPLLALVFILSPFHHDDLEWISRHKRWHEVVVSCAAGVFVDNFRFVLYSPIEFNHVCLSTSSVSQPPVSRVIKLPTFDELKCMHGSATASAFLPIALLGSVAGE